MQPTGLESDATPPDRSRRRLQWVGLFAGPALAIAAYLLLPNEVADPTGGRVVLGHAGRATAGAAIWMATWWMTEAIPVYATALIPLALFPLFGVSTIRDAASPYGHELIFLFMGGFIIALAMERWGLHRRLAFLALRGVGSRPVDLIGGFMLTSAVLSMWISNSATAIMLLPVALSMIELAAPEAAAGSAAASRAHRNFSLALLLGIAYGASIGGIGTLIGTPPNLFLASFAKSHLGYEISFVRWMGVGVPLVVIFLPLAWLLLTRVLYPIELERIEGGADVARDELARMGGLSRGERATLAVFVMAASLWILRPLLLDLRVFGITPFAGLSDAGIAMLAALAFFVIPVEPSERVFVMDWPTAVKLPWGLLVLFGGGLSLASAIRANGVGEFLGAQLSAFSALPAWILLISVITLLIFLTELTSNTATTATLIPILAALAPSLGVAPLFLAVPAAIAASCAFMLPVATPPNAIVFGSGRVPIAEMSRVGLWLNLLGVVLITALTYAVVIPVLGIAH